MSRAKHIRDAFPVELVVHNRDKLEALLDDYRQAIREEAMDDFYEILDRIEGTPGTEILVGWIRSELGHLDS